MDQDLFQHSRAHSETNAPVQDYEYKLWAERVIREVGEDLAREEKLQKDFAKGWYQWSEMVSFVSFLELQMHKREPISQEEMKWHNMFVSGLISLGKLLERWSKKIPESDLNIIGFSSKHLECLLSSIQESYLLWHGERSEPRIQSIQSLLPQ